MKKIGSSFKKAVCAALTAAAALAASGCTNYSKMMTEQPMDYISMAEENTMEAMNGSEEYNILKEAIKNGTFTVGFDLEGIGINADINVSEREGKTAQTYSFTGSEGTAASVYLFADKDKVKVGTNGLSGSHVYDIILDTAQEKLASSIFAPDSDSEYSMEQEEFDAIIEYAKAFSDETADSGSNSYNEIIESFKEANPPTVEEKIDTDISGTTVKANVITYSLTKEKIAGTWEQIADLTAENADPEQFGAETKEEVKEQMTSAFDKLQKLDVKAVYYINSDSHMLMKMEFSVNMSAPNEYTEETENIDIHGSTTYGADPAASDTVSSVFGMTEGSISYEFYIDTVKSESGSVTNIAMSDGETRTDAAVLTYTKEEENYTLALDIPEASITCKAEGTLKTDKDSFELTVDRLSAGTGSGEVAYSPKGVFKAKKGGEMNELDAEKEFLDLTEEEIDALIENIENDFSAVFDEFAEDSAMGNYIIKSRQSAANSNAKQAYTAAATVITEAAINETPLSGSELTGTGAAFDFGGTAIDVSNYLGTEFTGYIYGDFNSEYYLVDYVLWSEEPIPDEYKRALTSEEQEELAEQGVYIGCYPLNY